MSRRNSASMPRPPSRSSRSSNSGHWRTTSRGASSSSTSSPSGCPSSSCVESCDRWSSRSVNRRTGPSRRRGSFTICCSSRPTARPIIAISPSPISPRTPTKMVACRRCESSVGTTRTLSSILSMPTRLSKRNSAGPKTMPISKLGDHCGRPPSPSAIARSSTRPKRLPSAWRNSPPPSASAPIGF